MKKAAIKSLFLAVLLLAFSGGVHAASPVYFSVQYQNTVLLNRTFNLPDPGSLTLIDDTGAKRTVDARSVLAVLYDIQNTTSSYRISDLKYFPSFASLYVKCVQVPTFSNSACDDWQDFGSSIDLNQGFDNQILLGGETVYVYFGDTYRLQSPSSFAFFSSGPIGGNSSGSAPVLAPAVPAPHMQFNSDKAIQFLTQQQNKDGSFGTSQLQTDWAAIALGAVSQDIPVQQKTRNYLLTDPDPGHALSDYERRALALEALGMNPYSGTATNYIQKILAEFDGTQFGDPNLLNDDIFALLALLPAGYRNNDEEIAADISFLLKNQKSNGSFGDDVDLTAAAMQALSQVATTNDVKDALAKAKAFLQTKQTDSGSFGNIYSTSWALGAIAALGEDGNAWVKNGRMAQDFMEFQQASDGGVLAGETIDNRIWATSYAIPAGLGKDWGSFLSHFGKPAPLPEKVQVAQAAPVLSAPSADEKLKAIRQEVNHIAKQVDSLKTQVAVFAIEQRIEHAKFQLAELQKQRVQAPVFEDLAKAQAQVLPENTAKQNLAASVVGTNPAKNILFVLALGGGIFLLLGGWNLAGSFVRRKFG